MPQLDKLLSAMMSNHASALVLTDGEAVKLEIGGQLRPLTKTPLSAAQILTLLEEVATSHDQAALASGNPVEILRATPDGAFVIKGQLVDGKWRAVVSIGKNVPESKPDRPAPDASPGVRKQPTPPASPAAAALPNLAFVPNVNSADSIPRFDGIDDARSKLDGLLALLVQEGASAIHLRAGEPPMVRKNGQIARLDAEPPVSDRALGDMLRSVMSERVRIAYAAGDADFAYEVDGAGRFRINAARDRNGALAVIHELPATVTSVERVKVSEEVQRLCFLPKGLVLVTGPKGGGKSATLCALVDLVNRDRQVHVIVLEDPIEFVHKNKKAVVTQRQVGVHTTSFQSGLRAALREDPDVIVVGDLREQETIATALEAVDRGHLVFAALRTPTVAATIDRLVEHFPADRQQSVRGMLAESIKGIVSQTLCTRVAGGRVAAREVLLASPAITNLIREGKTSQIASVLQASKKSGMVTLNDALMSYVDSGEVDPKEAYARSADKAGLVQTLKSRGRDVSFVEVESSHVAAVGPPPGSSSLGTARAAPAAVKR